MQIKRDWDRQEFLARVIKSIQKLLENHNLITMVLTSLHAVSASINYHVDTVRFPSIHSFVSEHCKKNKINYADTMQSIFAIITFWFVIIVTYKKERKQLTRSQHKQFRENFKFKHFIIPLSPIFLWHIACCQLTKGEVLLFGLELNLIGWKDSSW